jgi:diaminopimelate decarboxylase
LKPLGPIPPGFEAIDGELVVGGQKASALAEAAGGTPLFAYSRDIVAGKVAALRQAMPDRLRLHYAVKANPYEPLLKFLFGLVDGFDVASAGELGQVLEAGADADRISFAGPGKTDHDLRRAIQTGVTLNLESEGEAARALRIAAEVGRRPHLAIRVNPDFELRGSGMKMGGGAKPFGLDRDRVAPLAKELIQAGAEWRGLHIYTGSQALDAEAVAETQANVLALAAELTREIGAPCPHLNMGGGFGIPYFDKDRPLDIVHVGQRLAEQFDDCPEELQSAEFAIELGRWLVGEAGVYLCRVIDRKVSHGTTYLVTDGGLHHQLAASGNFGTVVRRNYPLAIATRFDAEPEEEVNVVGCLCTPLDRLADQALLPRAEPGDLVAVFCAGAYGASASPAAFLGHGPAAEMLV